MLQRIRQRHEKVPFAQPSCSLKLDPGCCSPARADSCSFPDMYLFLTMTYTLDVVATTDDSTQKLVPGNVMSANQRKSHLCFVGTKDPSSEGGGIMLTKGPALKQ